MECGGQCVIKIPISSRQKRMWLADSCWGMAKRQIMGLLVISCEFLFLHGSNQIAEHTYHRNDDNL